MEPGGSDHIQRNILDLCLGLDQIQPAFSENVEEK